MALNAWPISLAHRLRPEPRGAAQGES